MQGSQMRWAERRQVGVPTVSKIHVDFSIIQVGERPSKWASSLENNDGNMNDPIQIVHHPKHQFQTLAFLCKTRLQVTESCYYLSLLTPDIVLEFNLCIFFLRVGFGYKSGGQKGGNQVNLWWNFSRQNENKLESLEVGIFIICLTLFYYSIQ